MVASTVEFVVKSQIVFHKKLKFWFYKIYRLVKNWNRARNRNFWFNRKHFCDMISDKYVKLSVISAARIPNISKKWLQILTSLSEI